MSAIRGSSVNPNRSYINDSLGSDIFKLNDDESAASKRGILLQQIDEGKPCLKCGDRCPGFSLHVWKKVCFNCKCPRENHDISVEADVNGVEFKVKGLKINDNIEDDLPPPPPIISDVSAKYDENHIEIPPYDAEVALLPPPPSPPSEMNKHAYVWTPPGLDDEQVELYMSALPTEQVPEEGMVGEEYYCNQLLYQLPPQDTPPEQCSSIPEPQREAFVQFWNNEELARSTGTVKVPQGRRETCRKCQQNIKPSDVSVVAENIGQNACYHAACFCCSTCGELLVNLTYFRFDNNIYCGRHHAELSKKRCGGCDELIFSGEYTIAMNKSWHLGHFRCKECNISITGKQFVAKQGKPVCQDCYGAKHTNECAACNMTIGPQSKDVSTNDNRHWHDTCFLCDICRKPLHTEGKFTFYKDQILCNNCYVSHYQKTCLGCGDVIISGAARLEFNGEFWHEDCFKCNVCHQAIGTTGFIPKDDNFYCPECYQQKFSKRCAGCYEPLIEGGVLYGEQTWHKECFICFSCNSSLASKAFSIHDDNRYCMDCYAKFFAKQCEICLTPIIGGEYFTLEDSNFHKECFKCSRCELSLANEGFVREGLELLCGNCAD